MVAHVELLERGLGEIKSSRLSLFPVDDGDLDLLAFGRHGDLLTTDGRGVADCAVTFVLRLVNSGDEVGAVPDDTISDVLARYLLQTHAKED